MRLEDWIDIWVGLLGNIEPTTVAKYRYFVECHILPEFQGRELGSLTFEEIEAWENAIPTRISARGHRTAGLRGRDRTPHRIPDKERQHRRCLEAVRAVTAGNEFGVYDLRAAGKGSNLPTSRPYAIT